MFHHHIFDGSVGGTGKTADEAVEFAKEADQDPTAVDDNSDMNWSPPDGEAPRGPRAARVWALLEFHALDPATGVADYSIRMNYTTVPTTRRVVESFYRGIKLHYQPVKILQIIFFQIECAALHTATSRSLIPCVVLCNVL